MSGWLQKRLETWLEWLPPILDLLNEAVVIDLQWKWLPKNDTCSGVRTRDPWITKSRSPMRFRFAIQALTSTYFGRSAAAYTQNIELRTGNDGGQTLVLNNQFLFAVSNILSGLPSYDLLLKDVSQMNPTNRGDQISDQGSFQNHIFAAWDESHALWFIRHQHDFSCSPCLQA